ncbi:DHA2 family efflux MFS transporter permease subunit [Streptococcus ratti]|uniref:Multidrug efflux MFS transporter n=1 Tax=Streptococcus ratti TaxID=1341 RepID=A0A7X9QFA5_STRRT|nr:DHA2 family efflux MFS transporter permease subunit [Streptococcus ratti]NMD48416.1 multidrug efflux MFS transporter [Streptococcus ratti]
MKNTLTPQKRTLIFISLVVSCIAATIMSTALTTALPAILKELNISTATGQWLTSGYSLVMAIILPLSAFLINRISTKKLYLFSLGIFLLGVVIAVFAGNFSVLMAARVLQAIGNGILTAVAQVVLLCIYPVEKRGSIMGWYGLSISAAPVLAPTLTGFIVDSVGWRAIFAVTAVVITLSTIFALLVFDNVLEISGQTFDTLSFILSSITFAGLTLGIGNYTTAAFFNWQVGGLILLGLIAGVIFTHRQLYLETPFLNVRVFASQDFTVSVLASILLYMVMMGSSVIMPIYVQILLGKSATISSLIVLPGSLAMAAVSPFAGQLFDKLGMRPLILVGSICLILSNLGMFTLSAATPLWFPAFYNAVRSISIGCLMMPLVTWGTNSISSQTTADGTALLTSLRTVGGAVGSAVFVGLMSSLAADSSLAGQLQGLNLTFLIMAIVSAVLFVLGLFFVKPKNT